MLVKIQEENPMKRFFHTTIAAFAVLLIVAATAAAAEGGKTYKIIFPIANGLSIGSTSQMVKEIGNATRKRTGLSIEMTEFRYQRDLDVAKSMMDLVKKNNLDFALISARDFARIDKKNKGVLVPMATITFFGKPVTSACMYTRKADNIKSAGDLKGKVWGGTSMIPVRYLLIKSGIKTPMKQFFGKQVFIIDENITNVMNALLDKKIDVFALQSLQFDMAKNADKKYAAIEPQFCAEYEHSWILVARNNVPSDVVEKVKTVFLNSYKDKEFAQFKFLFTAIKGRFIAFDPTKMKATEEVLSLMEKNNWEKEDMAFIKSGLKNAK